MNKYKYLFLKLASVILLITLTIGLSMAFYRNMIQEDIVLTNLNDMRKTLLWVGFIELILLLIFAGCIYYFIRKSIKTNTRAQKAELELLYRKEKELQTQYNNATEKKEFLETMAQNLPGGYHRCTTDHNFKLTFISNSFTQVTGYTMEQLKNELNSSYMGIVAPEDKEYFLSLAPQLERDGFIHCAYRMRRRDGSIRWVKDTTQYVERDGEKYYQCALMDIHDIITKQEELALQANMLDTLEKNMPGGYHRCADAPDWPFIHISTSFTEITGWTPEEIKTEFDNLFVNMVLPEDLPLWAGIIDEVQRKGYSNVMYRLKKKGGGYIWVSDSTMRVALDNDSFYHGVLADVTNQIAEMECAKQEAEASNRAKSTFLFNISHDIRTPINAIKGFSRIIEENSNNPELVTETIGKINQANNSLRRI